MDDYYRDHSKGVGRPLKYKSPAELDAAIDEYFKTCRIPTVPGLAYALGFTERHALLEYEQRGESFSATVKKARLRIEQGKVEMLALGEGSPAGLIFDLKNNHGYADKQEIDQKISGDAASPLQFVIVPPKAKGESAE